MVELAGQPGGELPTECASFAMNLLRSGSHGRMARRVSNLATFTVAIAIMHACIVSRILL